MSYEPKGGSVGISMKIIPGQAVKIVHACVVLLECTTIKYFIHKIPHHPEHFICYFSVTIHLNCLHTDKDNPPHILCGYHSNCTLFN